MSATRRPLPDLLRMLGHIDAVHGVYYLLIHCVVLVFGASETATRFLSVLATALAAGMLTALGRRLAGNGVAVSAGLLYAVCPPAIAYAQDARPFALATALVVISCYCFTRYEQDGGRRRASGYAVALTLTGWVNIVAMLVLAGNAVTMFGRPANRLRRRGFVIAAAAALIAVSPVMWLDLSQVHQVAWEQRPGPVVWLTLLGLSVLFGALTAVALRADPRSAALAWLGAPWLILPPLLLAAAAEIAPMWEPRYVLICLPALALLVAAVLARLPGRAALAAVAMAVTGMAATRPLTRPAVSADNLRAVSQLLQQKAWPGDAVVFPDIGKRLIKYAYPAGFKDVRDIGLNTSPADRDVLYGLNVGRQILSQRLASVHRLWAIRYPTAHPGQVYGTKPDTFCAQHTWQIPGNTVTLYRICK